MKSNIDLNTGGGYVVANPTQRVVLSARILSIVALAALVGMASVSSAALVAHYPFDGNANDVVTGGAANNGIENGGVGYSAGQFGQALNLDGTDDYVVIPDGGGAEVGAADYTIAFWLNTTDDDGTLIKTGTDGGPGAGIRALDSGNFGTGVNGLFQIDDNVDGPFVALPDPAPAIDGSWHHYAWVRDATNTQVTLYLDGGLATVGAGANPFTFAANDVSSPGEIGHVGANLAPNQTASGNFLEGMIDDLRFYDHALTQSEVQAFVPEPPTETSWNVDSFGDWNDAGNWSEGVPDFKQTATFGNVIQQTRTVIADSAVSVNSIQFDNVNTYVIAGGGSVNLTANTENPPVDPSIGVIQGSHQFQAAVNLHADTMVDVASNSTLIFNNALDLGGNTLTKTGVGEMAIRNDLLTGGGMLSLQQGTISGSGTVGGDVVNDGGTISPGNNALSGSNSVPEASAFVLALLGVLSLACSARRRNGRMT